jgi:hypothetical protein
LRAVRNREVGRDVENMAHTSNIFARFSRSLAILSLP